MFLHGFLILLAIASKTFNYLLKHREVIIPMYNCLYIARYCPCIYKYSELMIAWYCTKTEDREQS